MLRLLLTVLGISVQTGLYYYVWRRLVHDTRLPPPWRQRLSAVILVGALSLPIVIVMALVGALLVFAQGSALAPFIYTIF